MEPKPKKEWPVRVPRPPRDELVRVYTEERLTTRQMGQRYGVSKTHIVRWFKAYGIARRPPNRGLGNRGNAVPSRDDLERMIHVEHKPYREVAALYGVDPTAVPYWLERYGIEKPKCWVTRRKGSGPELPDRATIVQLYGSGESVAGIAKRYRVSTIVITRLCNEYGINRRPSGFGTKFTTAGGVEVKSSYELRVAEWFETRGVAFTYEPRLPFHRLMRGDFFVAGWYVEVWGVEENETYKQRKARKIAGYRAMGLPLVEIQRWHFSPDRIGTLEKRLRQCLIPPPTQLPLTLDD